MSPRKDSPFASFGGFRRRFVAEGRTNMGDSRPHVKSTPQLFHKKASGTPQALGISHICEMSNSDLVWSSDPELRKQLPSGAMAGSRARGGKPSAPATPERKHLPKGPCVSLETAGRKGKGVSLVTGLQLGEAALEELGKKLKALCGTGGTVKDGIIEIQGDHRTKIQDALAKQGISVRKIG
jgi:predicted translation initiation factor SUI1